MRDFAWVDGERTIHFGRGVAARGGRCARRARLHAADDRARASRPRRGSRWPRAPCTTCPPATSTTSPPTCAATVDRRPARRARRRARDRRDQGAGRRATAARAMAVPTTLSGAEMTRGHRHARGVDESTPRVRPAVVVFDPALAASQPVAELAASSLNALGHAVEGAVHACARTRSRRSPPTRPRGCSAPGWSGARARPRHARARRAARRLRDRLHRPRRCTTCSRRRSCATPGVGHGPANAAMLPHTIGALAWRFPAGSRRSATRRDRRARAADPRAHRRGRPARPRRRSRRAAGVRRRRGRAPAARQHAARRRPRRDPRPVRERALSARRLREFWTIGV